MRREIGINEFHQYLMKTSEIVSYSISRYNRETNLASKILCFVPVLNFHDIVSFYENSPDWNQNYKKELELEE